MRVPTLFFSLCLATAAFAQPQQPIRLPQPPSGLTLEVLNTLPVSSAVYFSTLKALADWHLLPAAPSIGADRYEPLTLPDTVDERDGTATLPGTAAGQAFGQRHLTPARESVAMETRITYSVDKNVEPTTIVQQFSGANYSTTVASHYFNGTAWNWFYTTTDFANWYAQPLGGPTTADGWAGNPSSYVVTGDPLLSENNSNSGIAPKRMYLTGIAFSGVVFVPPTGIGVWHSDNGGRSWSNPTPIVSSTQSGIIYDKPSIVTSWYGPTLGEVYVAYALLTQSGPANEIHVARSTNGGTSFTQDWTVTTTTHNVNATQILVDNNFGYLYLFWVDFQAGQIMRSTLTSLTGQWDPPSVVWTGNLVTPPGQIGYPTPNTRAPSMLMARYNSVAQCINLVWHQRDASGNYTDIYVASKNRTQPTWTIRQVPGVDTTRDQFEPALDFDTNGYVLIGYYTRREDAADILYREYSVIISADASTVVRGEEPVSSFSTDPTYSGNGTAGFVGDYHDVWYTVEFGRWHDAWIGRNVSASPVGYNVYISGLH